MTSGVAGPGNTLTGDKRAGEYADDAVRAQLLYTPTQNIEALFNVHFRSVDSYGVPGYSIGVRAGGANDFGYVSPAGNDPQIGDDVNRNNDLSQEQESSGGSLNLKIGIGELTLTSLTAYEEVEAGLFGDREQSPDEIIRTYDARNGHQISEELRLTSSPDQPVTWIAGAYYSRTPRTATPRVLPCQACRRSSACSIRTRFRRWTPRVMPASAA